MLEARRLECTRGRRQLFKDLSFVLRPGEAFELRGPNGSGKTSLLRMLCGLLPPTSGAILWHGQSIGGCRREYLASLTYVGHRAAVKDEMTTIENLRVATALSGCELSREEARDVLRRIGLGDQESLEARYLSEGQHHKLALARLVTCRTALWLLDEATSSLDATASTTVASLIDAHLSRGGMAIVATHRDLPVGARLCRRIELAA
jgi:heme exporter protein A